MQAEYVVLRKHGGRARPTPNMSFGSVSASAFPSGAAPAPAEVSLEIETLDTRDAEDLARDPATESVVRSMPLKLVEPMDGAGVDSFSADPAWGIQAVGADSSAFDGAGVTVAVLDTGIDKNHAAFAGANVVEQDFTGTGNGDAHGHGTHCAGTIAGRDVAGVRIGVAPGVSTILAGKVLSTGGGSTAGVTNGIKWALREGAQVISMSLGVDFPGFVEYLHQVEGMRIDVATSLALEEYRQHIVFFGKLADFVSQTNEVAGQRGAFLVAASGNESSHPDVAIATAPPAASEGITSVGAVGLDTASNQMLIAPFSNTKPNLVAPGVNIVSAQAGSPNGLTSMNGTSMATPHVAGVAALWAQAMDAQGLGFDVERLTAKVIGTASRGALGTLDPLLVGMGLVQAP